MRQAAPQTALGRAWHCTWGEKHQYANDTTKVKALTRSQTEDVAHPLCVLAFGPAGYECRCRCHMTPSTDHVH